MFNTRARAPTHTRPLRWRPTGGAAGGSGGAASRPPKPRASQAPLPADPLRPRRARRDLDRLRDDDGGRLGPAAAREQAAVQARGELVPVRRPLAADRPVRAAEQRRHRPLRRHLPGDAGRDRGDRGQALLDRPRRRHPRHRPCLRRRRHRRLAPGRLDDRPAVRQERPLRAGQPDGPREAPRGRARLPPHPPVEEAEDPHRVSELDLLRQRRLRRRVRRARVLRQEVRLRPRLPSSTTTTSVEPDPRRPAAAATAPGTVKCASKLTPADAALLAGMVASPTAFDPVEHPHAATDRRDLVLQDMLAQGYITRTAVRVRDGDTAADRGRYPAAQRADRSAVLHELAAPADPRRGRARRGAERGRVPGVLRRSEDPHDARSRDAAGRRAGGQLEPAVHGRRPDGLTGRDRQSHR